MAQLFRHFSRPERHQKEKKEKEMGKTTPKRRKHLFDRKRDLGEGGRRATWSCDVMRGWPHRVTFTCRFERRKKSLLFLFHSVLERWTKFSANQIAGKKFFLVCVVYLFFFFLFSFFSLLSLLTFSPKNPFSSHGHQSFLRHVR